MTASQVLYFYVYILFSLLLFRKEEVSDNCRKRNVFILGVSNPVMLFPSLL